MTRWWKSTLALVFIATGSACGTSDETAAGALPDGENEAGAPTSDAGSPDAFAARPSDPDDVEGAPWDGALGSPARLLALGKGAMSMVLTTDDQVVYLDGSYAVNTVPATGGTPAVLPITPDQNLRELEAGRAVLFTTLYEAASSPTTGWSKAAGTKVVAGMTGELHSPKAFPTASGASVLVIEQPGDGRSASAGLRRWALDPSTLSATLLTTTSIGIVTDCTAHGEAVVCLENGGTKQSMVWTMDASGSHVLANLTDSLVGIPLFIGDSLFFAGSAGLYRLDAGASAPNVMVPGATSFTVMQDGWLAVTTNAGVELMKADGSSHTVAAKGATIAGWSDNSDLENDHDRARIRWLPVCDQGNTNLRLVDPLTEQVVPLSSSSCDLRAISYSDDFALFIDNEVTATTPYAEITGDYMLVDLRDGSRRPAPVASRYLGDTYIQRHQETPLGMSRLFIDRLNDTTGSTPGCYFDGNSAAGTPCADVQKANASLSLAANYLFTADGTGAVVPVLTSFTTFDFYYLPLQ